MLFVETLTYLEPKLCLLIIFYDGALFIKFLIMLDMDVLLRVTKVTGSRSDDCIYWHFGYSLLFTINRALSLIYTLSTLPLHTH
jgi:hypothetical protein